MTMTEAERHALAYDAVEAAINYVATANAVGGDCTKAEVEEHIALTIDDRLPRNYDYRVVWDADLFALVIFQRAAVDLLADLAG